MKRIFFILFLLPVLLSAQATIVIDGTSYQVSGATGGGAGSTASGEKLISTVSANKTLALSDFVFSGNDEGKLSWNIVDTDVTITVPVITGTTRSAVFVAKPGVTITFEASSTQLFSMASEGATVNAFTVTEAGRVAITPISATEYSVDGINVTGYDVDNTNPTAVTSLAVSNVQNTSVSLSWTHATDNVAVSYYEFSSDGTNYTNIGYGVSYDATGLTASTTYTFYIRAVDTSGNVGSIATVGATTGSSLTFTTAGNSNTEQFAYGAGSFSADDTGIYDSEAGNSWSPLQINSQSAVAESVNGSTYVHEIIGNGSQYSRVRPRVDSPALTVGVTYEFDFVYKMVGGGTYGQLAMMGNTFSNLSATDWTVISGTFVADATRLSVDVYASSNAAAANNEGIRWKLTVKEQD